MIGGSYGGYMVLASLMHYSDRIRAGVDIVGISHFGTFLKNTESYRRDLRRVEYGDERDPEMKAFFERISPLNNAGQHHLAAVRGAGPQRSARAVHRGRADREGGARQRPAGLVPAVSPTKATVSARRPTTTGSARRAMLFWQQHLLDGK